MKLPGKKTALRSLRRKPKTKLKASVSRTASSRDLEDFEDEEYYEAEGPNLRLSHAFFVVLILHVIAVAGVFGFSAMKSRQSAMAQIEAETVVTAEAAEAVRETASAAPPRATASASTANGDARSHEVVAGDTLTRIAARYDVTVEAIETANHLNEGSVIRVGQTLSIPQKSEGGAPPKPAATTASAPAPTPAPVQQTPAPAATAATAAEGEVYEVVAGDNPYSIARRLGVSYQALLDLNNIDDPTKLQIGQKLKVPAKQ